MDDAPGYGSKPFSEDELPYRFPTLNIANLETMAPHNDRGAGHAAFATMFRSRNLSLENPYFLATHGVVYRLLWREDVGVSSTVCSMLVLRVLQPDTAMDELLLGDFQDVFPEQGLLSHVFRLDGPFPEIISGKAWNGDPDVTVGS